jgi:hypothetical protein
LEELLEKTGRPYSEELGIDLKSCQKDEVAKWFLASILFGARISENTAMKTYREFEKAGTVSPEKILETGWEGLIAILGAGGYARYDAKTATKLLEVFGNLQKLYGGDLNAPHEEASDPRDLEKRLKDLGKGIGDVTVSIFLRDMRYCWEKADPCPTDMVVLAMDDLGIDDLMDYARDKGLDLVKLETMLVRYGRHLRKKKRTAPPYDEVRKMEDLVMDILEDVKPEELSLEALATLTSSGRTYMEKVLLTLKEQGKVEMRKDEKDSYWRAVES